jgi:hypothetical protein
MQLGWVNPIHTNPKPADLRHNKKRFAHFFTLLTTITITVVSPHDTMTMTMMTLPPPNSCHSSCPPGRTSSVFLGRLAELQDVISILQRQEVKYHYPPSRTSTSTSSHTQQAKDPWKPIMISWMYNVVDIFQLNPIVVATATYYLDQAAPRLIRSPSDYQLLGLTTLCLAIKVHETRLFPVEELVKLGNSGFTCDEVIQMEQSLLCVLNWHLHPPTPECFVHAYAELLLWECDSTSTSTTLVEVKTAALPLVRQALVEEVPLPYSILSYAALLVAMEQVQMSVPAKQAFCQRILQVAGLSATTPGLAQAYQALLPKQQQEQPPTLVATPMVATPTVLVPTIQLATTTHSVSPSCHAATLTTTPEQQQESREEQTIIQCATDEGDLGFEVTVCKSSSLDHEEDDAFSDLIWSASWSPRNVALEPTTQ